MKEIEKFEDLLGETLKNIKKIEGENTRDTYDDGDGNDGISDEIVFTLKNGDKYHLYNFEGECGNDQRIYIDDICGDFANLIDNPILLAEEISKEGDCSDSTWTFYKLSTIQGSVTIRLYGESNGYYSESAEFGKCE